MYKNPQNGVFMDDRRYNRRYNVFVDPLVCAKADDDVKVKIVDISRNGICINIMERVYSGQEIHLEITIPEDDIPLFIKGEIAWVIKESDDNPPEYSAGIDMGSLNKCDRDRLIHYIHSNHHQTEPAE